MGETKGFLHHKRLDPKKEPVEQRVTHWNEFVVPLEESQVKEQAAMCMDCGVPFCHWACPLGCLIPDTNDFLYHERWDDAFNRLQDVHNFPEFTGRVCPAFCENSCVLGINKEPVAIKHNEYSIIEKAFKEGWVKPRPPGKRSGKTVAVVGSGPAGLVCADDLNRHGHKVTVYEKNEKAGGLLRYGIPDYKLEKKIVQRRVDLMKKEGVDFKTGVNIGVDVDIAEITEKYDSIVLAGGAELPRDLVASGRELEGTYPAMVYLVQQNRVNSECKIDPKERIDAKDKNVIVLGGGDTGADCVGTANRQGAKSIKQFELLPKPPAERAEDNPWPEWACIYREATSHEEGVEQDYCIMTKFLSGEDGKLKKLHAVRLEFGEKDLETGRRPMKEISGSEFEVDCDLLFLAMGFVSPVREGLINELGVELDQRGNVKTDKSFMTSIDGVFAAGDMRTGQSFVVKAMSDAKQAALCVDKWLLAK